MVEKRVNGNVSSNAKSIFITILAHTHTQTQTQSESEFSLSLLSPRVINDQVSKSFQILIIIFFLSLSLGWIFRVG